MTRKALITAVVAGVAVVFGGLALAQGPPAGARRGPPAGGMRMGRPGLPMLLAGETADVQAVNTDAGVDLKLTAADEAQVEELQARIAQRVANLEQMAEGIRGRMADVEGPPPGAGPPSLFNLLLRGQVEIAVENTDEGATVSFTSDNEDTVQVLQGQMPGWVQQAGEAGPREAPQTRRGGQRFARMREALEVLANEGVTLTVEQTDDGITVSVTSEDPELVKQVKEQLTSYFEGLKGMASAMRGMGAPPAAGGPPPGAPTGPPAGARRGPPAGVRRGPPADLPRPPPEE